MCLPTKPFRVEKEWEHAGLKCAATQAHDEYSHRCGYVRVPSAHPAFGKDYHELDVRVHGGVTFAEPEPCEHEDGAGWWVGFDCGHSHIDLMYDPDVDVTKLPEGGRIMRKFDSDSYSSLFGGRREYRRLDYVIAECNSLAEQLAAYGS